MTDYSYNPVLMRMRKDAPAGEGIHGYFENQDGKKLFYRMWEAPVAAKVVVCLHGAFAHGEFFSLVADRLVPRGITTAVFDYQGHGRSEGRRGDVMHFADWHRDILSFLACMRSQIHATLPVFLLGESMGGGLAAGISALYPELRVSGFILFSPAVKFKAGKFSEIALRAIPYALAHVFAPGRAVVDITGDPSDGITDPLHQEYDGTDPLRFQKASPRYLLELNKAVKLAYTKGASATKRPVIILQGLNDTSIDVSGVRDYFQRLDGGGNKKLVLVKGAKHSILDDPAFLPHWQDVFDWLDSH